MAQSQLYKISNDTSHFPYPYWNMITQNYFQMAQSQLYKISNDTYPYWIMRRQNYLGRFWLFSKNGFFEETSKIQGCLIS